MNSNDTRTGPLNATENTEDKPAQAAVALGGANRYDDWPPAYGWWLKARSRTLAVSGLPEFAGP